MRINGSPRSSSSVDRPARRTRWPGGQTSTTSSRRIGSKTTDRCLPRGADDPELELPLARPCSTTVCVSKIESAIAHLRRPLGELAEDLRHDRSRRARTRRRARAGRGAAVVASASSSSSSCSSTREQALRAAIEPLARLGRLDAPARAVDELAPDPLLERPDLLAHGRLRDAEPLGRLREAAPFHDHAERCELTRVHKSDLS